MNTIERNIDRYLSRIETTPSSSGKPVETKKATIPQSGRNVSIDSTCDLRGIERMLFGDNVVIQKDCWLNVAYDNPDSRYIIQIGNNSNIGRRCTISGANSIILGKNVLLGPNVFIADTSHEYRHAGTPIMNQGITTHSDRVIIGDGTWIGTNSVIAGNLTIGRHSVIGANSMVNRDIPDYCVAAGNPCRIRKIFDIDSGTWKELTDKDNPEYFLSRREDLLDYIVPLTDLKFIMIDGLAFKGNTINQIQSIALDRLTIIFDDASTRNEQEIKRVQQLAGAMGIPCSICTDIAQLKCPARPAGAQLFIDRDGGFFPCHASSLTHVALGTIHKFAVEDMWNSASILRYRKSLGNSQCPSCGNQE